MFIQSAALQKTRSSNPPPQSLHPHSLSWSDLHKPQVVTDWKQEALECVLFVVLMFLLIATWLVLPAWLEG
ncbi:MAG: hypothetical protein EBT15_07015 [Betaproteobacteria bacterium]|nr:hypothetical protein [Betaproteobacteria bacterium]